MKFLEFLGAKRFGLRTAELLKFTSKLRNRFGILKFTLASARLADTAQNFVSRNGFKILKPVCELPFAPRRTLPSAKEVEAGRAAWLTSQHTYDAVEKRRAVKLNHAGGYLNSARHYIARFCSAAARHGYKTVRAENFSKFDLTGTLLNFKSRFAMQLCSAITRRNYEAWRSEIYAVCLHKYLALIRAASGKISRYEVGQATNASLLRGVQRMKFYALNRHAIKFLKFLGARRFGLQAAACFLKFKPESSHSRSKILNFMFASYKLRLALRKFTPELRKIKSAPAVCLNFALNSVPHARAAKFENGVKFKGAAKFKRGAR